MRPIDADALHYELTVETVKCARMSEETKWTMAERVLNRLDEAPTLDPAQLVPQGEWVIHTRHFAPYRECSNCKYEQPLVAGEGVKEAANFCPNCGARMRKEAAQ